MEQDVEATQEKPPNACCEALKDKNTKLLEKCENLVELKNQFRKCTNLVLEKYDVIEKENESLKKAFEEINLQANMWKDEKEKEAGRRIDLEDEVSALQDEVRLVKQNGNSSSEEADKQLQERLLVAEKEIKQLNVLLGQERESVALEKKKANEALMKVEIEKNKVSEVHKMANAERINAAENRVLLEKVKKGTDDLKSVLALEKSKFEAAEKIVDVEKQKLKNDSQFSQLMEKMLLEKGHNILREKTCADSEKKKVKKQRLVEEHKRMAMEQKSRADHLSRELESYKLKFEESQKELQEFISCGIGSNVSPRNNDVASETDTVKHLNKQLELERLLVKHAKKATKLEAFRNKVLHQELCHLKQECCQFQQRLDLLDKSFLLGIGGIGQLEKIGNQVARADKSMRSPIKDGANKRRVSCREMEEILDAGESLENMYSMGPKLHQWVSEKPFEVHGILNSQKDNPKDKNLKETSCGELSRPCKKRKTSSEGTLLIHRLQNYELESMLDSNTNGPNECMPASLTGPDMKLHGHFKDGMNNNITGHYHCTQDFDEMVASDYMKLLDLDSAADEDFSCRAIAMPLSPTIPVVEFLEADNSEMLVCRSFQEGLSNVQDNPTSVSRFHVIESEKNHTDLSSKVLVHSLLQTEEGPMDSSKFLDPMSRGDTHLYQIHASGGILGMSDLSGSGNEEISLLRENVIEPSDGGLLNYLVVAPDKNKNDSSSILRILQTISSCMPHSSFIHSAEPFLRTILHTLLEAEALSIKEKACVFFSLILHGISAVGLDSPTNVLSQNSVQILDSVTTHMNSVFSDPVFRRIFMESCDLVELLAVIEDFLLQRKVLVSGEVSANSDILSISKLNLIINGNEEMLSDVVASAHLLVVGASLLALLCSAIDHIDFVCEVSCNIIRMQKFEPSVMLAVLHSFAHICGSRYLAHKQYALTMTVVKSLVIFLEKQTLGTNSTSEVENPSKIWLCTNCLFLEGAVPMEDVAVLLLENLQKQCCSESCSQDSLALIAPRVRSQDGTEEGSGSRESVPLSSTSDEICDFIYILSLVEVLASFMSWDWTCDHLIRQICEYLESRLMEGSSAAIIVLLGQLGRFGADAGGYDGSGVEKLRGWLSAFVCESSFPKYCLSVQFAIITCLFRTTTIKLEDIVEGGSTESHSIPARFIREWFFSLTQEQQSFILDSSNLR
ncbi:hypothetical protein ACS0TY_029682 [Phlomoides rotata]